MGELSKTCRMIDEKGRVLRAKGGISRKKRVQSAARELTWKEAKIWAMVVCEYYCQKCGEKKEECELEAHHREFYPEDGYVFSTTEDIFKVMGILCSYCHDLLHFVAWKIVKEIEKCRYPLTKKELIDRVISKVDDVSSQDVKYVLEELSYAGLIEQTRKGKIYLTQKGKPLSPRIKKAEKFIRRIEVK